MKPYLKFLLLTLLTLFTTGTALSQENKGTKNPPSPYQQDIRFENITTEDATASSQHDPMENLLDRPGEDSQNKVLILTDETNEYPIGLYIEILEDKEKQWSIEDITSPDIAANFVPSLNESPGFGFTDSAYWIRFRVRNEASSDTNWLVLYETAAFFVDYYVPSASGEGYDAIHTGSALPFDTRDVPVGRFVFRLPVTSQESKTVYIRFASDGSLILALTVLSEDTFTRQAMAQQVFNGILYGTLLVLAIYNIVIFYTLRDRSYLYYVLFFSTMLIGIMALDGFAAQYLWPNQGQFAAIAIRFFMIISFNFGLLFAISFLRTKEYVPRLNIIMTSLAILVFIFLGLQFVWFRETAVIHVFLLSASSISMVLASIIVWRKGYRPARYFLIGWLLILVGFIVLILTLVDMISLNILTDAILRIGLIVLALVLSVGLAERINTYRLGKDAAIAEERNRLARDLHDSVTQSIYSASLLAEVLPGIWRRDPDEAEAGLEEIRYLTRGAMAEMRTMLLELRPETLIKIPLDDLMNQLVEATSLRMELETKVDIQPVPVLPSEVHVNLYRVAQEALNNVVKHSQASQLMVRLLSSPRYSPPSGEDWRGEIQLEVHDNGKGFNPGEFSPQSLGLGIMHERAREIKGTLLIESQPGQGTQVSLVWDEKREYHERSESYSGNYSRRSQHDAHGIEIHPEEL